MIRISFAFWDFLGILYVYIFIYYLVLRYEFYETILWTFFDTICDSGWYIIIFFVDKLMIWFFCKFGNIGSDNIMKLPIGNRYV